MRFHTDTQITFIFNQIYHSNPWQHHMRVHMEGRITRARKIQPSSDKCFTCELCGAVFNRLAILKVSIQWREKYNVCLK